MKQNQKKLLFGAGATAVLAAVAVGADQAQQSHAAVAQAELDAAIPEETCSDAKFAVADDVQSQSECMFMGCGGMF